MANASDNLTYNLNNFSDYDTYLFKNGNHFKLYEKLGAHPKMLNGIEGTYFAVWAPNAKKVSLVGDFNYWDKNANPMGARWDHSGIWETFIPQVKKGSLYKFHITSKLQRPEIEKCDPFAFFCEIPPKTASVVWALGYRWNDEKWMKNRHKNNNLQQPLSIYEIHLGSWKRIAEENNRSLSYREIAESLSDYIKKMGFTHVEFMPLMEHPFYGSWGYQVTGYFSPTSRYGNPQDFMFLVDCLHQNGIGVILDWVPSHFPDDPHGLAQFDGSFLYEHQDPKKGFHPDWKSLIFNYSRNEVKEFLISSALFWLEKYHMDGLRIDAVASMLYLDYSRKAGEWIPNRFGGRENLEAIDFIKQLNETVYREFPTVQIIAEESTAWPAVTKPTYTGGLGFGMKWNMGWMHDTLNYFSRNTIYRKFHQNELTFTFWYAFTENFILPLSHDEIVYGKKSLLEKMPGDRWQKFANLRLLLAYMYGFPGKKLLFMGDEFGQLKEWSHEESIQWELLGDDMHRGLQKLVIELNRLYTIEEALYNSDFTKECFEWVDFGDYKQSVLFFIRKVKTKENQNTIVVACNFTPTPRYDYRIGVPYPGIWKEIFNSDAKEYGGSGHGNLGKVNAKKKESHSRSFSISITLPPLSVLFFKKNSHKPINDN
jgi:1,4-alpha-glucan branching enzyme